MKTQEEFLSKDRNQIVIQGHVITDASIMKVRSGNITVFSIAVQDGDYTSYFDIKYHNDMVLNKGMHVTIIGKLIQDRWDKDGKAGSRVQIIAEVIAV